MPSITSFASPIRVTKQWRGGTQYRQEHSTDKGLRRAGHNTTATPEPTSSRPFSTLPKRLKLCSTRAARDKEGLWISYPFDLLGFEQGLYLRQPGHGTSNLTGTYLLEQLLQERSKQLGDAFTSSRWFDEVNQAGLTPVSLIRWQVAGKDDEIRALTRRN